MPREIVTLQRFCEELGRGHHALRKTLNRGDALECSRWPRFWKDPSRTWITTRDEIDVWLETLPSSWPSREVRTAVLRKVGT